MESLAILIVLLSSANCYPSSVDCSNDDNVSPSNVSKEDTGKAVSWLPNTNLAVSISKKIGGDWKTSFYAHNRLENQSRFLNLNLKHEVLSCGETEYMVVSGNIKDTDAEYSPDVLGKDAASISNSQREGDAQSIGVPGECDKTQVNNTVEENLKEQGNILDRIKDLEEKHTSLDNTLKSMEEHIIQIKNFLKNMPDFGLRFDANLKTKNIELSNSNRTATRTIPFEMNALMSGVVTQRPLFDDEMFLFRIDRTRDISKDYGVHFGLAKLPPNGKLPGRFILHMNGTWTLSSRWKQKKGYSSIVIDNKTIFSNYPADLRNLPVGTTLGVKRSSDGTVRFYLNGIDKGVAFHDVPEGLDGYVDIVNYVTQISVIQQWGN